LKEDEKFRQAWNTFTISLNNAIRKQETEKDSKKIEIIKKEIDGTITVLTRLEDAVFAQWRNYITKTEYKVYYKIFQRDLSKTIDQWWASVDEFISHLDSQKKRLEAIKVSTGEKKTPTEAAETEITNIAERWWIHCEAIKNAFKDADTSLIIRSAYKFYKTKEVKDYLNNLELLTKKIIDHINDIVSTARRDFINNFANFYTTKNLNGLIDEIEELEKMLQSLNRIITVVEENEKTESRTAFLRNISQSYRKVIEIKNVQDLKSLRQQTIKIIKK